LMLATPKSHSLKTVALFWFTNLSCEFA